MKRTLLDMVQSILNDMDSDDVNSISDTSEATQIASIVKDTYYNIISTRDIPEHKGLLKLTAASDSDYPTHFQLPDNTRRIDDIWYENSEGRYIKVQWEEPLSFLWRSDQRTENVQTILSKDAGVKYKVATDSHPCFYTSFDDEWIVMDGFESTVDSTLQASKTRAYGTTYPDFTLSDSFVPDLDATLFPYLLSESKSVSMSVYKGASDPKIEQAARRNKSYIQNDRMRVGEINNWSQYGRC